MKQGRETTATYKGRTYTIPEMWLAGYCRDGATLQDAVKWWAYQTALAEQET